MIIVVVRTISKKLIQVWSTVSGALLMNSLLVPLAPCARSCALSADGSMAVAGFDDGSLKVHSQIIIIAF